MAARKPKGESVDGVLSPLITVTVESVDKLGFFCYMSKKKSEGYQRKLRWLKERLSEGMRIKMMPAPERGFIEYVPGEYAWRAVHADGYMFIHCLWVVGKSKGRGFGIALLDECLAEAKRLKMKGVAMVTSERVWLAGKGILQGRGFECVEEAPPSFALMVKKFGRHASPSLAGGWEEKARVFGPGLTVVRSDQCPYIVDATETVIKAAEKSGLECRTLELTSRADLLELSPTPYGVFGIVLDGRILSYHYLLEKDLIPLLG